MGNSLEKSDSEIGAKARAQSPKLHDEPQTATKEIKQAWWHPIKQPGSAAQIVVAAVLAIGIGLAVSTTVDEVPEAAVAILKIPGNIWLRGLQAIGRPPFIYCPFVACNMLTSPQSRP